MAKDKQPHETDEFLEALQRIYTYCMENMKFLAVIAGGVLAGILIIILVLYQVKMTKIKDAMLMNQAVAAFQEGKSEEALASLEELTGKGGFTGAAASLYQGNILYEQTRYEDALKHYEKARDVASGPDQSTVRGLALQGIAYSEIALKEFDKAEEVLKGMGEPFQDLSLLELGRLYLAKGEKDKASEVLERLIQEYPDSPWASTAEKLK